MSETFESPLPAAIDELWERRAQLTPQDTDARGPSSPPSTCIDAGKARVAHVDRSSDEVIVDERAKRAILLSFRVLDMVRSQVGDFHTTTGSR